jgi:outer membrane protein OmpA-like peptidoglycan-associated protein/Tol biopolymer transport system component
MRSLFVSVVLFFLTAVVYAQQSPYSTTDKDAIKYYVAANREVDDKSYGEAIINLQKAIAADSKFIEAHALMGDIYRLRRYNTQAIESYKKVLTIDADFNRAIYIKIGELEVNEGQYANGLQYLEKYLTYPNITPSNQSTAQKLITDSKFSIDAMLHPVPFTPVNIGAAINTPADEYSPAATADEKTLIFTRQINGNEDFYQANQQDKKWQTANYLSDKINTATNNEGSQSISQDGKYLFFTGCNRPDGLGRCDIYISQKKGDEWGKPFDLSPPINTSGWESQPSISADGRTLYFVSNRKGGYGGYDIWKSQLTDKGWGEPENLGPNINTAFNEQSPFIHADNNTLYFCSNGWPGMGNQDLFVSRLGTDAKWGKPENLGYPINSHGDETALTLTANGTTAYFASNNLKGFGGFDIYTFEMPVKSRPLVVTYVKGIVMDAKTKQPLESAVEILDLQNEQSVYEDYSSEDRGDFLATLTSGKNYGLNISKTGYLFYSENFSLIGHQTNNPFNITVLLEPIEVGNKVILKNIFFDTNKFELKPESKAELQKLLEFLAFNPSLKIEISGHTDNVGNDQLNQTLSQNRAKAVYDYLIAAEVPATRLVFKGYGKTQPITPNDTDDSRSKNRRTEFKIIAK